MQITVSLEELRKYEKDLLDYYANLLAKSNGRLEVTVDREAAIHAPRYAERNVNAAIIFNSVALAQLRKDNPPPTLIPKV